MLADYVLALIRVDTPEPELRVTAVQSLEDFLKEGAYHASKDGRRLMHTLQVL